MVEALANDENFAKYTFNTLNILITINNAKKNFSNNESEKINKKLDSLSNFSDYKTIYKYFSRTLKIENNTFEKMSSTNFDSFNLLFHSHPTLAKLNSVELNNVIQKALTSK